MPLYIRDDHVDALAIRVQRAIGARTKTEAVRRALEAELARREGAVPMRERIARSLSLADAMGPSSEEFDLKAFSDAMWK